MFPVSREELCWEEGEEENTRSEAEQISNSARRPKQCCSLAASEKQGTRRTRRGKASSVGRRRRSRYFENSPNQLEFWQEKVKNEKNGVLRLENENRCTSVPNILYLLPILYLTPTRSKDFFLQNIFFFCSSSLLLCKLFSANPFEAFQYQI